MAAPFFNTPFQPYVYQSPQDAVTPFQILGGEAQIVQIMLKPQEQVIARPGGDLWVVKCFLCCSREALPEIISKFKYLKFVAVTCRQRKLRSVGNLGYTFLVKSFPGSMCYTSGSIQMDNIHTPELEAGVWHWIFGRSVTSIFLTNTSSSDGFVGVTAPSLARILPIDLAMFGGELLCQPDAFLCSVNDVKVTNTTIDQRARIVVAGAESFLRQKLSGRGLAFIIGGGSVVQKNLEVGEVLVVDASCVVALTTTVNVQVKHNITMRRAVFGAENQVTATLTGPGIVFIQSLPFPKLSQRVARAVTAPNLRENPKLLIQLAIFFFLAYVVMLSSLILTDV